MIASKLKIKKNFRIVNYPHSYEKFKILFIGWQPGLSLY